MTALRAAPRQSDVLRHSPRSFRIISPNCLITPIKNLRMTGSSSTPPAATQTERRVLGKSVRGIPHAAQTAPHPVFIGAISVSNHLLSKYFLRPVNLPSETAPIRLRGSQAHTSPRRWSIVIPRADREPSAWRSRVQGERLGPAGAMGQSAPMADLATGRGRGRADGLTALWWFAAGQPPVGALA